MIILLTANYILFSCFLFFVDKSTVIFILELIVSLACALSLQEQPQVVKTFSSHLIFLKNYYY